MQTLMPWPRALKDFVAQLLNSMCNARIPKLMSSPTPRASTPEPQTLNPVQCKGCSWQTCCSSTDCKQMTSGILDPIPKPVPKATINLKS